MGFISSKRDSLLAWCFLPSISFSLFFFAAFSAAAFTITDDLEAFTVPSVGTAFQSFTFENSYSGTPVVVCNGHTGSNANWLPVVRIDGLTASGMDIRVQKFANVENDTSNPTVAVNDVHCIVSSVGVFQLPDGTYYQAGSVLSDGFNDGNTWNTNLTEEETSNISANLTGELGVLAQITSYNDVRGQVAHVNNCTSRARNPFDGGRFCVGRQTGMYLTTTRADENVGYIVFQTGSGDFVANDGTVVTMAGDVTTDTVRSVDDSPPYSFSTGEQMEVGVTTQLAEDGGNGSYSGLYGPSPLAGGQIDIALDESANADRNHTHEFVAWWAFGHLDTSIEVLKDVDITTTSEFDLLTYTISVENTGEVDFAEVTLTDFITQDVDILSLDSGPTLNASTDTDADGELDEGETWTYTATYQLTDDNFDNGADVENEASVEAAVNVGGDALDPETATAVTELIANPLVEVVKSATLAGGAAIPSTGVSVGDIITYRYDVENTGNVALAPVAVSDQHFGAGPLPFQSCTLTTDTDSDSIIGAIPFEIQRLGAGDIARCSTTYTVTQDDIDAQ